MARSETLMVRRRFSAVSNHEARAKRSAWLFEIHIGAERRAMRQDRPATRDTSLAQKENARGERAFSIVNLGVVGGLLIIHVAFGGLVKNHVNSQNSLADDVVVRT